MKRPKVPLKAALIGGFVGLQLVAVAVILASSYLTSERVLTGLARNIMENLATYIINQSEDYLRPARDAARLTERLANHHIVSTENLDQMESYFYEQLALHGYLSGLYYGDTDGNFLFAMRNDSKSPGGYRTKIITHPEEDRRTELVWKDAAFRELFRELDLADRYDPRTRPWYRKAAAQGQLVWTDPYVFYTARVPGITTASPVYDAAGQLAGVVGVDIEIDAISRFLAQLAVGESGRAFILSRDADVIAFPEAEKIRMAPTGEGLRLAKIDEMDDLVSRKAFASLQRPQDDLALDAALFSQFEHAGRRYHALFAPFHNPQWPWIIGIYLPEDDFLGPIKRNREQNLYLALAIATLASLVGLWLARSISGTMRAIRSEAMAIRGIDLSTTFDKGSFIKEIEETAEAFTQMKAGLEVYKQENDTLTADLQHKAQALQAKETRLRATFATLVNFADALVILDQDQRVRFLNPAAKRLLGVSAAGIKGGELPFECRLGEASEVVLGTGAQARVAELSVVETEWEGGVAYLASMRDITKRHSAERSLAESHGRLREKVEELEWRQQQLTAINKMAELFHVCATEREVIDVVSNSLSQLFPVDSGALYLNDGAREVLQCAFHWGDTPRPVDFFGPGKCWAVKQGRPHLVRSGHSLLRCEHVGDGAEAQTLCLPFSSHQKQLGLIYLCQRGEPAAGDVSLQDLKDYAVMVAEHFALALSNARLQENLQFLAVHDALTGLHNRRYLQDIFHREIGRARRREEPIGVVIMDIDYFKQTNDRYGHDAGDAVLMRLGKLLREHTRSADILCRYGGEEFLLLLVGSGYEDSLQRARDLRDTLRQEHFYHDGRDLGAITLSFGIATYPDDGDSQDQVIKAADDALYRAKHGGRDRICGSRGELI